MVFVLFSPFLPCSKTLAHTEHQKYRPQHFCPGRKKLVIFTNDFNKIKGRLTSFNDTSLTLNDSLFINIDSVRIIRLYRNALVKPIAGAWVTISMAAIGAVVITLSDSYNPDADNFPWKAIPLMLALEAPIVYFCFIHKTSFNLQDNWRIKAISPEEKKKIKKEIQNERTKEVVRNIFWDILIR